MSGLGETSLHIGCKDHRYYDADVDGDVLTSETFPGHPPSQGTRNNTSVQPGRVMCVNGRAGPDASKFVLSLLSPS